MNPLLKGREVGYHLKDSGAKLLVAWHGFAEPAQAGSEEAGAELILRDQPLRQRRRRVDRRGMVGVAIVPLVAPHGAEFGVDWA
jgi:hypothetical protein